MEEYSGILGQASHNYSGDNVDMSKLKANKYYQNHLRALELQREQEKADNEDLKIKIMA